MYTTPRYDVETLDGALVTSVGPPPGRDWKPVTPESTDVTGTRVVLAQPTTWWWELRVVSEPFPDGGHWYVRVVDEEVWYLHGRTPHLMPPHLQLVVPLREVWIDG